MRFIRLKVIMVIIFIALLLVETTQGKRKNRKNKKAHRTTTSARNSGLQSSTNIETTSISIARSENTPAKSLSKTESTTPLHCEYIKRDSSNKVKMALVNQLETEGWLPKNSIWKVMSWQISRDELEKMVLVALVKSGRISPLCINQTLTTTATTSTVKPKSTKTTTTTAPKPKSTKTTTAPKPKSTAVPEVVLLTTSTTTTKTSKRSTTLFSSLSSSTVQSSENDAGRDKDLKKDDFQMYSAVSALGHAFNVSPTPKADEKRNEAGQVVSFHSIASSTVRAQINQLNEIEEVYDDTWFRNLIMSKLPDQIRIMIENGEMPADIEDAIFSGSHSREEIVKMIVDNDKVLRAMLPKRVLNMIQDRPIPDGIKQIFLSGKNASEIKKEIEGNTTLLQQLMTPSTYFFYQLFSKKRNQNMNSAISAILIVTLAVVMTSLGCTMTISEIKKHVRKPKGVFIALISQFVIMPAASFGLTQAFGLKEFAALAVLICGCCPGGNLSNILAYALKGDMNLSILMTTCSSILGLGFMPLNIYLYSKLIIPLDSGEVVPFAKIVLNISLTIFPVGIGIAIRHFRPKWVKYVMKIGAIILIVNSITVGVLAGVMFGSSFFVQFPLEVVACCAILPLIGYVFGFLFGWIGRESPKCMRTISVETGCQNVQLCSTVLKLAFDPILVGVLFLMPMIYMCFQILEALLMVFSFRLYHRCRYGKQKDKDEHLSEEKKKSNRSSSFGVDDVESSGNEKANLALMKTFVSPQNSTTESEDKAFISNGKSSRLDSVRSIDSETFV